MLRFSHYQLFESRFTYFVADKLLRAFVGRNIIVGQDNICTQTLKEPLGLCEIVPERLSSETTIRNLNVQGTHFLRTTLMVRIPRPLASWITARPAYPIQTAIQSFRSHIDIRRIAELVILTELLAAFWAIQSPGFKSTKLLSNLYAVTGLTYNTTQQDSSANSFPAKPNNSPS